MELKELVTQVSKLFEADKIEDLNQKIMSCVTKNDFEIYAKFCELVKDLSIDWLQMIFQYYLADRKEKKQDYTPKSLAAAACMLAGVHEAKTVYDMCAGSGALTIQAWTINSKLKFICQELDENVIPFLLFNLAIRNINAIVINGNVLSEEQFNAYKVISGEEFSSIMEIATPVEISADCCISNPPYNIKWEPPVFAALNKRYKYGVPPASNANYAFILAAVQAAESAVLILPNTVLESNTNAEKEIQENLIEENLVDSIVQNPDSMFESTGIGTCLFSMKRSRQTAMVAFIDARNTYTEEIRLQNGQFGGSAHTGRTYQKVIKAYSSENINSIISAITNRRNKSEFSAAATKAEIKEKGYSLRLSNYIAFEYREPRHRPYADIVRELNTVVKEKNSCKLVINETLAKSLGFDIASVKQDMKTDDNSDMLMEKLSGEKPVKSDYITFTKNKGEFVLKANDPEHLPELFKIAFVLWKQHIAECNNRENILLAEYRDALLPELLSGQIEL